MKRAALIIALATFTTPALADNKAACRKAFEQAQSLRDERKMTAAREQMITCGTLCPAGFAKVCNGWLVDLDKLLPTIVLRAVDDNGSDLVDVSVTIDDTKISERLDGKAFALDPGPHKVLLVAKDLPPVTKEIVVAEGEKNRPVVITIAAPKKKIDAPPPPPPPLPPPATSAPIAAIVVTSVGVAALGGFAYFGLKGDADHRALVDGCSRTASCTQDDKDSVKRQWLVADVFLASGVVLVGIGTYLFLSHESKPAAATVGFAPTTGGGQAALSVSF